MKRLYYILLSLFLVTGLFTGIDTYAIQQYEELLNNKFENAVYLKTDLNYDDFFLAMQHYSKKYHLDIERVEYTSESIKDNKQTINVYLLLTNDDWFRQEFNLSDKINPANLKKGEYISSLKTDSSAQKGTFPLIYSYADVFLRPFHDLDNRQIEGKYNIHINSIDGDFQTIIEEINSEGKITLYADFLKDNVFVSDNYQISLFYRWLLQGLLLLTIIIFLLHQLKNMKKATAIKKMFGQTDKIIFFDLMNNLVFRPIMIIATLVLCIIIFLYIFFYSSEKTLFYLSISIIIFIIICALTILFLITAQYIYWIREWRKQKSLATILKGEDNKSIFFSYGVKAIALIGLTSAIVFCGIAFSLLEEDTTNFSVWEEQSKNYVNLELYIPEYIIQDDKKFAQISLNISNIWERLNCEKNIMFYYIENAPLNDDKKIIINGHETRIPFAYINENYLSANPILDSSGKIITDIDDTNNDVVTILVPEMYKDEEDYILNKLHFKHVKDRFLAESIYAETLTGNSFDWKENFENNNIKERILYVQNNQNIFSYNTLHNCINNPILFIVNENNMGSNVYFPSIFGGSNGMKIWYDDLDKLDSKLQTIFEEEDCSELTRRYVPLYESKAERIFLFQSAFNSSLALMFLSLLALIISLASFVQLYLIVNRKKIVVMHSLGISFFKIHERIYLMLFAESIIRSIIVMIIYIVTLYKYAATLYFNNVFLTCFLITLLDLFLTTIILKNKQGHVIISTLKGD